MIYSLLFSSLFLAVGGGGVYLLLRFVGSQSPFVHRTAWAAVLLLGVLWVQIHGDQSENRYFSTGSDSFSPSAGAYRGDGLFSFQVPIGLQQARLRIPSDTDVTYRVQIDGKGDWLTSDDSIDFPLGTIEKAMKIDVAANKSPKITLNVVDESGKPVEEYYAWAEYTKHGTPAKIKVDGDKIRVDITPERYYELNWDFARSELSLSGILDVSFKESVYSNIHLILRCSV